MLLYADSQFTSPYVLSVFVALKEKQIPFELRTLDLNAGENLSDDYANESLTQRVPTLVYGDFALSESSAITEYLEDLQPEPALYPKELKLRAKARQIQAWIRSDLLPIRAERTTNVIYYTRSPTPLSDNAVVAANKLFQAAEALLSHGSDYIFGSWSICDVDLTLMLNRLILNGDDVPLSLRNYAEHQWNRKSVQEWVGLKRPPLNVTMG